MIKDRFLILVIIFLFVLNLFTLGYLFYVKEPTPHGMHDKKHKGPPGDDREPDRKRPDEVIINRLKLNNDQVLKFENLKNEHRKQVEELQFASKKLHDEYFGLLKTDNPDIAKASQLLTELGKNQQQLDKVTYEHFQKIKDICDKDQKLLFNTFIDEIAASFKPPIHKK